MNGHDENAIDVLNAVLEEAYLILNEMSRGELEILPMSIGGVIADDLKRPIDLYNFALPEEISDNNTLREGARQQILVNAYERNPIARRRCIELHGVSCVICGFNFGDKYGKVGTGFIHVHHLMPLSEVGEEYKVDPVKDLRPVCPNCHAIIHLRTPPYTIEEVKEFLREKS